jgi:alpha-L-rhamnosidase
MTLTVTGLRAEYHHGNVLGLGESRPRLSWITLTDIAGWTQASYEVEVNGKALGRTDSDESLFVEWPGQTLESRSRVEVRIRVWGNDGSLSEWSSSITIEAGLLSPGDWRASWITPKTKGLDGRPTYLRHLFDLRASQAVARARLYATSAGINRHQPASTGINRHQPASTGSILMELSWAPASSLQGGRLMRVASGTRLTT